MYKLWLALFSVSCAITLWFSAIAAFHLWEYHTLSHQTSIEDPKWSIQEISTSQFMMQVDYTYRVEGRTYHQKTLFKATLYPNPYAAKMDLPAWEKKKWKVWYDASNPERASLQKIFPAQNIIHAALTIGVTLYFYLLKGLERSSWVRGLKTPKSRRL